MNLDNKGEAVNLYVNRDYFRSLLELKWKNYEDKDNFINDFVQHIKTR